MIAYAISAGYSPVNHTERADIRGPFTQRNVRDLVQDYHLHLTSYADATSEFGMWVQWWAVARGIGPLEKGAMRNRTDRGASRPEV